MTQDALNQLIQDRYREAIKTYQSAQPVLNGVGIASQVPPNIEIIELRARVELLERGETIGMGVE